jgi:hypothetical protein
VRTPQEGTTAPPVSLHEVVRDHLARGWSIVPVRPADKRPLVRWEEFQHRRASADEALGWLRAWPDAGIGVVTGAISGLVVLDVDPAHGGDASLARLEREHGGLPATVEARTGGGGRHLYFAHPGGLVRNKAGLAPGIDLRGDGGYVVAPPSLHASGRRYAWVDGRAPAQTGLAPLPAWVLARAPEAQGGVGHPLAYWRRLVRAGVHEGERNSTIASLAGHLLWHGVDPAVVTEMLLCWNRVRCRPPLADGEVVGVVESITRLHTRHDVADRPPPSEE